MVQALNSNEIKSYNVLISLSITYVSIMIANAVLTNRYIGSDNVFILGGTLTSPLIFILDDVIAEIYGYKIARNLIILGYIAQTIFVFICLFVVNLPHPSQFQSNPTYYKLLGPSLMWINFSGFFAYLVANTLNAYIITRWKIMLKGKFFWIRSLGSSSLAEAIYSFIAIILMEIFSIPLTNILKVILLSYSIKLLYSLFFAFPMTSLVKFLKNYSGIDIYDFPKQLTPESYLAMDNNKSY